MAKTAVEELYQQIAARLSLADRIALAQRILQEAEARLRVEESDAWTEEDMREVTAHALRYSERAFGEE